MSVGLAVGRNDEVDVRGPPRVPAGKMPSMMARVRRLRSAGSRAAGLNQGRGVVAGAERGVQIDSEPL